MKENRTERKEKQHEAFISKVDAYWARQNKQFDGDQKKAERIADPAERIIALEKISESMAQARRKNTNNLMNDIFPPASPITYIEVLRNIQNMSLMKKIGTGVGTVVGAGALFVFGGIPGIILFGTATGLTIVAKDYVKRTQGRDTAEYDVGIASISHRESLQGRIDNIKGMIDGIVEKNVKAISKSSSYDSLMSVPGISQKFCAIAAKQFVEATDKMEAAAAKTPASTSKKPHDFKKVIKAV